jgi:hypothetical protein
MLLTATGREVSLSGGSFSGNKASRRFSLSDCQSEPSAFMPKFGTASFDGAVLRTSVISVGAINTWFAIGPDTSTLQPIPLFEVGVAAYLISDEPIDCFVARFGTLKFAIL